jgi:uncharacterized protein YndB with AHSA1/START domain
MYQITMTVPAPPVKVFPLLCPVREHEWIEGWHATVLRSQSGVAERGCVFQSGDGPAHERCTWIVVEHEPPRRVVFALFQPGAFAEELSIDVEPSAEGSNLTWQREVTALSLEGAAVVARRTAEADAKHAAIERALVHFVTTGACLPWPR